MMLLASVYVLLAIASESYSHNLPSYFPRCHLEDPDLNGCIKKAANVLRPYIRKGIPEINFPSFNPYLNEITSVIYDDGNIVNITATAWNYTVRGFENYNLTEVRYNPETFTFNGSVEFISLHLYVPVEMQGHFLNIPVDGNGTLQYTMGPISGTYEVNGKLIKRNGVKYYKPTNTKVAMTIGDGLFDLNDYFNGNKELGRVTTDMLNRNSKIITDAFIPVFVQLSERGLMYLMKSLMQTVPYDILFSTQIKNLN